MKRFFVSSLLLLIGVTAIFGVKKKVTKPALFPDGKTPISAWFSDTAKVDVKNLGKLYVVTQYGVKDDSTLLQTQEIQQVIDRCSTEGGGVVVIPKGTFLSGALFFKKGTHLHVAEGGKLKGIDAIKHYPLVNMHMEGLPVKYFAALVNADGVNGFTITGKGTIDGNARRFWEEFWIRRQFNRQCTNLEALRPQLVYISHSDDVTVQDVRLINSAFWTNHLYRCDRVKYLDCYIESPTEGETRAPSSDGIDLDDCDDVLVKGCYINVCDDGVCLKGGRGTYVDQDSTAGPVNRVIVDGCRFGKYTNAGVTFGSDAFDCSNIILRNSQFDYAWHIILFKMRTDTPQSYRNVLVENCWGTCRNAIEVSSWKQFHALDQRPDMPTSIVQNVTITNMKVQADKFFYVKKEHPFNVKDFTLSNITAQDKDNTYDGKEVENLQVKNVTLNGKQLTN